MDLTIKFYPNGALVTIHNPAEEGRLAFDDQMVFTEPASWLVYLSSLWPAKALLTSPKEEPKLEAPSIPEKKLCECATSSSSSPSPSSQGGVSLTETVKAKKVVYGPARKKVLTKPS